MFCLVLAVLGWASCCWMNYSKLAFGKARDFSAGSPEITIIRLAGCMKKLLAS